MSEYIGISENKLRHILGVARKAYAVAKDRGHDEELATNLLRSIKSIPISAQKCSCH